VAQAASEDWQAQRNHSNKRVESLARELDRCLRDTREKHLTEVDGLKANIERLQEEVLSNVHVCWLVA
jgi:hypothetical protein